MLRLLYLWFEPTERLGDFGEVICGRRGGAGGGRGGFDSLHLRGRAARGRTRFRPGGARRRRVVANTCYRLTGFRGEPPFVPAEVLEVL